MDARVTIRPLAPALAGLSVTFDLAGDVRLAGGLGGWAENARARRTTAVEWTGTPARTQVLPLLIDGVEVRRGVDVSVEPQIRSVHSWGAPNTATNGEPPVLAITGPVFTDAQWVLNDVDWGAAIRDGNGRRVQQYVTVTLLEYISAELLRSPAKKVKRGGKNHK